MAETTGAVRVEPGEEPAPAVEPSSQASSGVERPRSADGYAGYAEAIEALRKPSRNSWIAAFVLSLLAFVYLRRSDSPLREGVILAGVVLFHELGHVAAMRGFGYRDVRVFFIPFFGALTTAASAPPSRWKQAVVSLAGPVPGLLVALALFVSPLRDDPDVRDVAWTALALNAFNLLPLGFLDGGRVLDGLVFQRHRVLEAAFALVSTLLFLGLGWVLEDWVIAGFALLWLVAVPHAYKQARAAARLKGQVEPGEVAQLPASQLDQLYAAAVDVTGPGGNAGTRATVMRELHARATTPPASRRATLGLTAVWFVALAGSIGVAFAGARPNLALRPVVTTPGDPVTPAFTWGPGIRAEVRVGRAVETTQNGKTTRSDAKARTAFVTSAGEAGGIILTFENRRTQPRSTDPWKRLSELIAAQGFGELQVTAEGQVAAVRLAADVEAALQAALATRPDEAQDRRALKERTLRLAAETPMRELWGYSVAAIPLLRLEPGVEAVIEHEVTNPLTGQPVASTTTYRLEGRVPCTLGGDGARCLLITYFVERDEAEVARQARAFAGEMTGASVPEVAQVALTSEGFVMLEEKTSFPRLAYHARTQRWSSEPLQETREEVRFVFEPIADPAR